MKSLVQILIASLFFTSPAFAASRYLKDQAGIDPRIMAVSYLDAEVKEKWATYFGVAKTDDANTEQLAEINAAEDVLKRAGFYNDQFQMTELGGELGKLTDKTSSIEFKYWQFYRPKDTKKNRVPFGPDGRSFGYRTFNIRIHGIAEVSCANGDGCKVTKVRLQSVDLQMSAFGDKGSVSSAGGGSSN